MLYTRGLHTFPARRPSDLAGRLLGEPMREFHRYLRKKASEDHGFRYHYVSAREMVNIAHTAEAGETGEPSRYRDFYYKDRKSTRLNSSHLGISYVVVCLKKNNYVDGVATVDGPNKLKNSWLGGGDVILHFEDIARIWLGGG